MITMTQDETRHGFNTNTREIAQKIKIDSETKIITRLRTKCISTLTPNECNN